MVLERFRAWLAERGLLSALESGTAVFVAHGGWDLVDQLPKECARKGIALPDFYGAFADLKILFALACPEHRGTSLKQMLEFLGLPQVCGWRADCARACCPRCPAARGTREGRRRIVHAAQRGSPPVPAVASMPAALPSDDRPLPR